MESIMIAANLAQASDEPTWLTSDLSFVLAHLKENTIFDTARIQCEWDEMKALAIKATATPRATADVEHRWINVADRLPERYKHVLAYGAKRCEWAVMRYDEHGDEMWEIETSSEFKSAYAPKFWMHLPPAPEVIP